MRPKTENPLELATIFLNMHWKIFFKSEIPSDVIHTEFEKKFLKYPWTKRNSVYIFIYDFPWIFMI